MEHVDEKLRHFNLARFEHIPLMCPTKLPRSTLHCNGIFIPAVLVTQGKV